MRGTANFTFDTVPDSKGPWAPSQARGVFQKDCAFFRGIWGIWGTKSGTHFMLS